jgi:hypothetical protein
MTLFPLIAAAAIAGLPVSDPVEAQPRAGSSQQGISNLMTAALAAMRDEADAVGADRRADSVDRRSAQTQYARAVRRVRGCDAVVAEIAARPEIMGQGIEMIAMDAIRDGDRACATRLAPIIIERAADPGYEPAGQIGLRFRAGAILDGAGQPEGKAIMREAEAELQSRADRYAIWESRFDAIEAYPAGTAATAPISSGSPISLPPRAQACPVPPATASSHSTACTIAAISSPAPSARIRRPARRRRPTRRSCMSIRLPRR